MLGSAASSFSSSETTVDPFLGFPLAFAKLCHDSPSLFADTPPHCFLPYSLSPDHAAKLRELDALFPCDAMFEEKEVSILRVHADFLWTQLDHLGNAGFDPATFRVDPYGNVLHRNADPSSPLAWIIDHWFPLSRGGRTRVENLRLVQWQVAQCKGQRLEFLIPWWELQLGISVNQFLSVFASENTDFRRRAFSLLFLHCNNGSYSELESHYWPQHFKQNAEQNGLAAAAVVKIRKHKDYQYKSDTTMPKVSGQIKGAPDSQQWGAEDEEALLIALKKYNRHVKGVEIEKNYGILPKIEEVQSPIGCEEALKLRHSSAISCMRQEKEAGETLGLKLQQTKDQVTQLENELKVIKQQNEKEKAALEELENILEKHKKQVEKQRHWLETQLHYRQCLERIVRDTLHQSFIYKEKTRLNQAACTALLAKIQSQRMSCKNAELDVTKQSKEIEALEILALPNLMEFICRRLVEEGFLDNNGSIMDQEVLDKVLEVDNSHCDRYDKKCMLEDTAQKSARLNTQVTVNLPKPPLKYMDTILEGDEQREESPSQIQKSPLKRKVASGEYDVHVGCDYQRETFERIVDISQGPIKAPGSLHDLNVLSPKLGEDNQLEDFLQEVLALQDKLYDVTVDEENEEHRITRLGKVNVDKWLQKLLLNDSPKQCLVVDNEEGPHTCQEQFLAAQKHDELANIYTTETGGRARKGLSGLFRRMGFRYDAKKLGVLQEKVDIALDDAEVTELLEEPPLIACHIEYKKYIEADHTRPMHGSGTAMKDSLNLQSDAVMDERSIKMKQVEVDPLRLHGLDEHFYEEKDAAPSELGFVKRMREPRELDKVKQSGRTNCLLNAERPAEEVHVHATLHHQQHLYHPEKNVKEDNNQDGISNATFLSSNVNLPLPDKMTRSYSMRTTSSDGRWVLHTRKGSDVFPSTMGKDPMVGEEVEIVLQPSSSLRRECESHGTGASGSRGSGGSSGIGLKASLKTCTKAWKRAVSKRSSNSQGTVK